MEKEEEPTAKGDNQNFDNERKIMKTAVQSMGSRFKDRRNHFVFHRAIVLCVELFLRLAAWGSALHSRVRACVHALVWIVVSADRQL